MARLLTLDEAKAVLRFEDADAARDKLVLEYVDGITSIIEAKVGWVVKRDIDVEIRQGGLEVALPGSNVLAIKSGTSLFDGTAVDVTGLQIGFGGILRNTLGSTLPAHPWTATLTVGMDPIPPAIKRGAGEVLIEAWATQRGEPSKAELRPFLTSYRAAEWFVGYEQGPGFA